MYVYHRILRGLRGQFAPLKMFHLPENVLPPLSFSQFSQFIYFSSDLCPLYFSKHWFSPMKIFPKKTLYHIALLCYIPMRHSPLKVLCIARAYSKVEFSSVSPAIETAHIRNPPLNYSHTAQYAICVRTLH